MARILLVEDENVINMVTQDRVEGMGHAVCGAVTSGQEAIDQAGALQPDVIIMDITLRGRMDGIEAARQIREKFGIPVIYLTAYDDDETRQRAATTGPAAYLVKIFEDIDLQSAIDEALRRGRTQAGRHSPADASR